MALFVEAPEIFMSNVVVGWKFLILWVLVCVWSGVVGIVLSIFILSSSPNNLGAFIALGVVGIIWGIQQYLVLKNYTLKINTTWVLASAAGIPVILFISGFTFAVLGKNISFAVACVLGAIFQYLVLRQHFLRSSSWILANAGGGYISLATGEVIFKFISAALDQPPAGGYHDGPSAMLEGASDLLWSYIASVIVGLAIYGAITGGTLVWLLRHPRRK